MAPLRGSGVTAATALWAVGCGSVDSLSQLPARALAADSYQGTRVIRPARIRAAATRERITAQVSRESLNLLDGRESEVAAVRIGDSAVVLMFLSSFFLILKFVSIFGGCRAAVVPFLFLWRCVRADGLRLLAATVEGGEATSAEAGHCVFTFAAKICAGPAFASERQVRISLATDCASSVV
jgi:hypothetical protein